MDAMAERLQKMREERIAREKARIERLRQINLSKYSKPENAPSNLSLMNKSVKSEINVKSNPSNHKTGAVKNNFHVNGTTKRPISAPLMKDAAQTKIRSNHVKVENNTNIKKVMPSTSASERKPLTATVDKKIANKLFDTKKFTTDQKVSNNPHLHKDKKPDNVDKKTADTKPSVSNNLSRKSFAPAERPKWNQARKLIAPPTKTPQSTSKTITSTTNDSVFERLYKNKTNHSTHDTDVEKLHTDPNYLKKVIRTTGLILNKRHTVFDTTKPKIDVPVRRSISAVHLKRISKQQLSNCIHKWSSIGDNLNNLHLKHINEDDKVHEDRVVSAIKSERRKVTFMSPAPSLNTPRPEELQARLKSWLQKRGKSLDSYHHLQCFGIHHLPHTLRFDPKIYDDENKENIAVASDSDDDSYTENMNEEAENENTKWRAASIVSDSVDFNESQNTTTTCSDVINTNDVVIGALNDLTELLREGFEWEQCARWLRAIRERFPSAPNSAAYWECRAALEERRGDLPASVQCWEEAIVKGTEHSVVEANLDQLLDKFMQLKISPNSVKSQRPMDSKMVDLKNVFKSTIIRFAVQQGKLRQSGQSSPSAKFCVTPVRRSGRLSAHWSERAPRTRTPLQLCSSLRHATQIAGDNLLFVPNQNLHGTP